MNEIPAGINIETSLCKTFMYFRIFVIYFFYINKSIIPIVTFCHGFFIYVNELLNYSVLYKKLLLNMQSIDSLRELNSKLLAEIAELREKLLRFAEVEAENARLKQIIE